MVEEIGKSKRGVDRRTFLGAGITSTVALAAGTSLAADKKDESAAKTKSNKEHPYNERTHKAMPTHNLGKTGYQVGIFSLGGQATVEIEGKEEESIAIINKAIDLGVKYIDTAASYGKGVSETHIGKVLKYRRHEVFLASKIHDRTYDGSMKLLERSLSQL